MASAMVLFLLMLVNPMAMGKLWTSKDICVASINNVRAVNVWKGVCYWTTGELTQVMAQRQCEAHQGVLAAADTNLTHTLIVNMWKPGVLGRVWAGIDKGSDSWYDGTAVTWTNWASGEPNGSPGEEECVELYYPNASNSGWNDAPCQDLKTGMCQAHVSSVGGTASAVTTHMLTHQATPLSETTVRSKLECATRCLLEPLCMKFIYQEEAHTCSLYQQGDSHTLTLHPHIKAFSFE